jgi:DNA-binding NtrC family response regulator
MKIPSIYAVDDQPQITELYSIVLQMAGYQVKTFNDRVTALDELQATENKPDLVITDCLGHSIAVDQFMHRCLNFQPSLKFLIASGSAQRGTPFACPKPDHFIQKPFTPEQFLCEVRFALAA